MQTTFKSRPITVTAVQIPDAEHDFTTAMTEAFGEDWSKSITIATVPISTLPDGGTRLISATMTTIQGRLATARPGEWIVQEQDDPTKFYPCADDVFIRRYTVRGRTPDADA